MISRFETHIDENFYRFFTKALSIHVGIVILAIVFQKILGFDLFKVKPSEKKLNIIQSAVRVDVVAMPKFTVQELKKMQVAPAPSETIKEEAPKAIVQEPKPNEVTFKEKSKKKINLKNLLSNLGKKPKAHGKRKKSKKVQDFSAHRKQLRNLILEGNKVSKGSNVVGDSLNQDNGEFSTYVSTLPNFVRPFWKLPTYLIDRDLKCRIRIFIAANGKILRSEIFESSGIEEFDKKAIAALSMVKSLPIPKSSILPRVAAGEVVLGFPL
jgi:outer membrane biosynthesis protein TonB